MLENISNIKTKIEELSSFFEFFRKNLIKQTLYRDIEYLEKFHENTLNEFEDLKKNFNSLEKEYKNYQLNSESKIDKITTLYDNLQNSFNNLKDELDELDRNHKNLLLKDRLITKLLSSIPLKNELEEFKHNLNKDFYKFANHEETLANEAEAILKLQSIEKELELITIYPNLYQKSVIAIGGGFSSGKSSFINSLIIDKKVKLPEGINPTTAIPTYVMHKKDNEFIACNHNGGIVDLLQLDEKFHEKLSHDFIKSFGFNLKHIMPFMIIGTDLEKYEHLCFIDTPGYNPASSSGSYSYEDMSTSKEFIENAQALLWVVGLDSNGTISKSDLEFLNKLELKDKRLFIVLNKADVKTEFDIKDILSDVDNILDSHFIDYIGISAYSSLNKKEVDYIHKSLLDFLDEINKASSIHNNLIKKLYEVDGMYRESILKDIVNKETISTTLKSLSLDLLQEGLDDFSKPFYRRLDKLKDLFNTDEQEENLNQLDIEIDKLKKAIDKVFKKDSNISYIKMSKDMAIEKYCK